MTQPAQPATPDPAPASALAPAPTPPAARTDVTALVAVTVTVLAWASAFVVIRWVGASFDPGPLAVGRLLLGSLALGVALLLRGRWVWPTPRQWGAVLLCGVAWFGVYNLALNAAEQRVDAGTASMLVNIGPILIALLAGLVLGEGLGRWLLVGVGVAFAGTVTIGVSTSHGGSGDLLGVALCVVAALTYAVGVLSQKRALDGLAPLQVTWLACTVGALVCLPFTPRLLTQLTAASPGEVAGLVYLGLVPTALAFGTWAVALSRMDASRLGVSTYLVPPLTVAMGWLLLGETPPLAAFAGGALCLAGVALARRRAPEPTAGRTGTEGDSDTAGTEQDAGTARTR